MKKRIFFLALLLSSGAQAQTAPTDYPGGVYNITPPVLADKQTAPLQMDANGQLKISGTISATTAATATAADPSYSEGVAEPLSQDLSGHLRVVGTITPSGTQDVNVTEIGGNAVTTTLPVSGTFWQATQPVSGTFWQATQPVSNAGTFAVQCTSGCAGSGGTSSSFSAAFPATGTAAGFENSSSGNMVPGVVDNSTGGLNVNIVGGGGSGGTSSAFSAAFPSDGTAAGMKSGTNMVPFTSTDGTSLDVAVVGSVGVTGTFWQATQPVSAAALPLPTGAATEASLGTINTTLGSPFQAGGSIGNTAFGATQSGTWTVQPGNTANSTAWLVTGTGGTFPVTGTFWQATQPVSGTVAATQSGSWSLAANQSVNVAQINGVTPLMGNGASGTGVQRVTIANDSTGILAGVTTVTTLTGTTTLTPGTAAANLGKAEDAAAASADSGVFALGVRNETLAVPTSTDGDYSQVSVDNSGRVLTIEAPTAAMVRGAATTTGISDVSLVAASGSASLKTYIRACQFANTGSTTTLITLKDGSGGSALAYTINPAASGSNITFPVPLVTTANTALYFAAASASTTVYASCQGYKAP